MTGMDIPGPGNATPTRLAVTIAGVFLASMIGTFALWSTVEPDCARAEIVAFEAACAGATTVR